MIENLPFVTGPHAQPWHPLCGYLFFPLTNRDFINSNRTYRKLWNVWIVIHRNCHFSVFSCLRFDCMPMTNCLMHHQVDVDSPSLWMNGARTISGVTPVIRGIAVIWTSHGNSSLHTHTHNSLILGLWMAIFEKPWREWWWGIPSSWCSGDKNSRKWTN